MRKNIVLCGIFAAIISASYSQTSVERIYIQGGKDALKNYMEEIYHYPKFEMGTVEYKNGRRSMGRLNYNRVIGNIQFLDEKGDTLALANPESIHNVSIGNDRFIYTPDCLLEVIIKKKLGLVKHESIKIADKQKTGGFGIPNTSGTIESIDRTHITMNIGLMDVNEKLLLRKTTSYFFQSSQQ